MMHQLRSTPHRLVRIAFEASKIEPIVGHKRIAEMSADEYLKLARESQRAMSERPASKR
jgi:hypothetical protein